MGANILQSNKDIAKEFDKTGGSSFLHFAASPTLCFQAWTVKITVDIVKDLRFNGNIGLDVYPILNQ